MYTKRRRRYEGEEKSIVENEKLSPNTYTARLKFHPLLLFKYTGYAHKLRNLRTIKFTNEVEPG